MLKNRRKADRDHGIGEGWDQSITGYSTGWLTCSRCGTRTYIIDQENGECLICKLSVTKRPKRWKRSR